MPDNTKNEVSLFAILIGCTPTGRNIEQHDVLFAIGSSIQNLDNTIKTFWYKSLSADIAAKVKKLSPSVDKAELATELLNLFSTQERVHIDAWMRVQYVDGYRVKILQKNEADTFAKGEMKLFFINLGGYKENEFEEFHKKMFVVAATPSEAINKALKDPFIKDYTPVTLGKAGVGHLDDKHKMDLEADDIICISDTLEDDYALVLERTATPIPNENFIGYVKLNYEV